jgi:hypothetical protein
MGLDVASYRRVAERWSTKEEDINPSAAAVLMLQMCSEIERLRGGWIPTSERLPDRNEIVLATDQDGVTVGSYSPMLDDWWTLHGDRMAPGAVVTHWMPLPEPPELT